MNAVLQSPHLVPHLDDIDVLNRECFCFSLDQDALARALDSELGSPGLSELVRQRCPFVFAAQPVFVAAPQLQRMAKVVQAVESVVTLPAYREQVLGAAPAIARLGTGGPRGAFFGYDFHLNQGHLGLTPHPQAHALYADKRNLALFSDAAQLQALGVPQATQQVLLEHVPRTEVVDATQGRLDGAPAPAAPVRVSTPKELSMGTELSGVLRRKEGPR